MISKTSVASRYKHISRRVLDEFPRILRQVVSESEHNQARFAISKETMVESPLKTIGSFNRQFQLTQKESASARRSRPLVLRTWALDLFPIRNWVSSADLC